MKDKRKWLVRRLSSFILFRPSPQPPVPSVYYGHEDLEQVEGFCEEARRQGRGMPW